jgi:hypothetical protein
LIAYTGRPVVRREATSRPRGVSIATGNRVLGAITGSSMHFDELGEPGGVVGDAFLGDQLTAAVDDGDVVMGFGPINAAEQQCHV